jgi:hypothetical protein
MSLEKELREQLAYELSGIEGFSEVWLDALDKQDVPVPYQAEPPPPEAIAAFTFTVLNFCRESIFRLAREIDELRTAGDGRDDLG